MLEGGLLETQETLKVNHLVLQEKVFLQTTVNPIVSRLPLPKDAIVHHNHLFNPVGGRQDLLVVLLSVRLDLTNLGSMSPPLPFRVINLEKNVSRATKRPYIHFSHPGFQFQYPG